jgi:hypothetical protein
MPPDIQYQTSDEPCSEQRLERMVNIKVETQHDAVYPRPRTVPSFKSRPETQWQAELMTGIPRQCKSAFDNCNDALTAKKIPAGAIDSFGN